MNYDGAGRDAVRELMIHNALYWIEEFNLDGLRLDAVHAIIDDSALHLLAELADACAGRRAKRHVHLLLENEGNEAHLLERGREGAVDATTRRSGTTTFITCLHTAATGEEAATTRTIGDTGEAGTGAGRRLRVPGRAHGVRAARGEPSAHLPPTAFVAFIQNHDQIGNRAFGERLDALRPG